MSVTVHVCSSYLDVMPNCKVLYHIGLFCVWLVIVLVFTYISYISE